MVDAAQWLSLIPEAERRRWAWLTSDPNRTLTNPLTNEQVYNPLYAAGDILGVLGTAVKDPIYSNVTAPAVGAAVAAGTALENVAQAARGMPTQPLPTDLSREGLLSYYRQRAEADPANAFLTEIVADPTSWVGGPIGALGRAGAGIPIAGRALSRIGALDDLYSQVAGKAVGATLGALGDVGRQIPGVKTLLEASPGKALSDYMTGAGRAVSQAEQALRERGLTLRDLIRNPKLDVRGTPAEWETHIKPAWSLIDDEIAGHAEPTTQLALLDLRKKVAEAENVLNARGEQTRIALMEGAAAGQRVPRQANALIARSWRSQQKGVRALQLSMLDAIDAVRPPGGAAPTGAALAGATPPVGTPAAPLAVPGAPIPAAAAAAAVSDFADDLILPKNNMPVWAMTKADFADLYPHDFNLSAEEVAAEGAEWLRAQRGFGQGPGLHRLEPSAEGSIPIFYNDPTGNAVAMATVMGVGPGKTPWVESMAIDTTRGLLSARAAKAVLEAVASFGQFRIRGSLSPQAADLVHRAAVERAAAQGKAIPPEVLAEYLRLRVAPGAAPPGVSPGILPVPPGVPPPPAGPPPNLIREALDAIRGYHEEAQQVGISLRGGPSPMEGGERMTGVFNPRDAEQRIVAMQAQDLAYRRAYDQTIARLDQTAFQVERGLTGPGSTVTPEAIASTRQAVDDAFRVTRDLLAPAVDPVEETLRGVGGEALDTFMTVWEDAPQNLARMLNRTLRARESLIGEVRPAIVEWFEDAQLLDPITAGARADEAFADGATLLAHPAMLAPKNKGLLTKVEATLRRHQGGDLLADDDLGRIAVSLLGTAKATDFGVKKPPPWMGAIVTSLGAWKELAIASPRFHLANWLGGLTLSAFEGVSPGRVVGMQARKARELARTGTVTDEFDAAASPLVAAHRGTGDTLRLTTGVTGNAGEARNIPGLTGNQTNVGKIPFAIRSGVPALATGAASYQATPEDDPNRTRNAIIGALLGGGFGAAAPKFVRANRLLSDVTETGARGVASLTGYENAMGTLSAAGKGDGLLARVHDQIPALLSPTVARSVGKRLTPLGPDPTAPGQAITTMADLFAPGVTRAGRPQVAVRGSERLDVLTTAGEGVDATAVQRAFASARGMMSPDALADHARAAGATEEQALNLRSAFDDAIAAAETEGLNLSNSIHFNYADVSKGLEWARSSGLAPFATWTSKAMPKFASIVLQHPGLAVAIDELNTMSDADIEEAGLTPRYARLARLGVLGDFIAERILGRAGTTLGRPIQALFPYADVGQEPNLPPDANPLQRALAMGQTLGIGLGPLATLPLMATGALGELPTDLFRTSAYLRGATTALTGVEADPEAMTKQLMRAARTATGAGAEPTITGDFLKDRAIRQRIAEIAVERTGKPATGAYLAAMDDPDSQLFREAQREIERQRIGEQLGTQAVLPFRTKFLSETEERVRGIREGAGVGPAAAAARAAAPPTAAELKALAADIRARPLKAGETGPKRLETLRWSAAENAAARIDPLTRGLQRIGGDEQAILSRQKTDFYGVFLKRLNRMPVRRRGPLLEAYLADKPLLRKFHAENRLF